MEGLTLNGGAVFSGRYRVVGRIGAGGFGAVYEAAHVVTERRCALKVLLPHLAENEQIRARFLQESRVAAKIASENVVDVLDAGVDPETAMPFIVMELLQGEDLAKRLARKKTFSADEVVVYMSQVAAALDRTHAEGVIHRDLKPGNLFLTEREDGSPWVKVLDFGIAKLVQGDEAATTTHAAGTPVYMAPEQFRRQVATAAADIYALAMIAFKMLVGTHYWDYEKRQTENAYALGTVVMNGPVEPAVARAARYGVALPPAFDAWFASAAAPDPSHRFATAGEAMLRFAEALGVRPRVSMVSVHDEHTGALSRSPRDITTLSAPAVAEPSTSYQTAALTGAPATGTLPSSAVPTTPAGPASAEPSQTPAVPLRQRRIPRTVIDPDLQSQPVDSSEAPSTRITFVDPEAERPGGSGARVAALLALVVLLAAGSVAAFYGPNLLRSAAEDVDTPPTATGLEEPAQATIAPDPESVDDSSEPVPAASAAAPPTAKPAGVGVSEDDRATARAEAEELARQRERQKEAEAKVKSPAPEKPEPTPEPEKPAAAPEKKAPAAPASEDELYTRE